MERASLQQRITSSTMPTDTRKMSMYKSEKFKPLLAFLQGDSDVDLLKVKEGVILAEFLLKAAVLQKAAEKVQTVPLLYKGDTDMPKEVVALLCDTITSLKKELCDAMKKEAAGAIEDFKEMEKIIDLTVDKLCNQESRMPFYMRTKSYLMGKVCGCLDSRSSTKRRGKKKASL